VLISGDIVVKRGESSQCSPAKIYWTFVVRAIGLSISASIPDQIESAKSPSRRRPLRIDKFGIDKQIRLGEHRSMEASGFKLCPFCKEQIRQEAIKCHFCGEWLEPSERDSARKLSTATPGVTPSTPPQAGFFPGTQPLSGIVSNAK
jgi:hypothetical protein